MARRLWHGIEAVNAVTYFSPECIEAPSTLGLQGFWMGYFGCRAAPLGPVGPGVVEATFFNFHPERVRRAIPDAWARAAPDRLVEARAAAAAAALRRLLPDGRADELAQRVTDPLRRVIDHATPVGRALFAANRDVDPPGDPVAALWQAATTLREHRGDGHVALLTGAGLDGCEVHVLASAAAPPGAADAEVYRASRGWSDDDWRGALDRLVERGLVDDIGAATDAGRTLHAEIEDRTDDLAAAPFSALADATIESLVTDLARVAPLLATDLRFPNPMGLPEPDAPAT